MKKKIKNPIDQTNKSSPILPSCFDCSSRRSSLPWEPVVHFLEILGILSQNLKLSMHYKSRRSRYPKPLKAFKCVALALLKYFWIILPVLFTLMYLNNFWNHRTKKNFTLLANNVNLCVLRFTFLRRYKSILKSINIVHLLLQESQRKPYVIRVRLWCNFVIFLGLCNVAKSLRYWTIYAYSFHYDFFPPSSKIYVDRFVFLLYFFAVVDFTCLPFLIVILYSVAGNLLRDLLDQQRQRIGAITARRFSVDKLTGCASLILKATSATRSVNAAMSPILLLLVSFWLINSFYNVNKIFNVLDMPDWFMAVTTLATMIVFFGQYAYTTLLATKVCEEYDKVKAAFVSAAENSRELFSNRETAIGFELLLRVVEQCKDKITATPMGVFRLDSKAILTTAGILITYSAIMLQGVSG